MKKLLLVIFIALSVSCADDEAPSEILTDYLPKDSAVILQMKNPDLFFSNLQNNEFLKLNATHKRIQEISSKVAVLNYFPHSNEALLALTIGERDSVTFTFISRGHIEPIALDSIRNVQVETLTSKEYKITKYILEGKMVFSSHIDSITILSSSREQLENSIKGKFISPPALLTAFKAASNKKPTIFINQDKAALLFKDFLPGIASGFGSWTALDADISQSAMNFNGISAAQDSIPNLLNVFKDVGLAKNTMAAIAPVNSRDFTSVTFQKFEKLKKNLEFYNGKAGENDFSSEVSLLQTASEAGVIHLPEGSVFAIRTLDPEAAKLSLEFELQQSEMYREIAIFKYPAPTNFQQMFQPLLNPGDLHFFAFLDTYVLLAENPQVIKELITAVQNDLVLSNTGAYKTSSESLSSEASILLVRNNQEDKSADLNYEDHPISAVQFIYQDNFAHVHGILAKNSALKAKKAASQAAAVSLGATLASKPVFFKNHRTKGMDIAVQDVQNTLYLISPEGKIHWKKSLDFRILGEVQTVDIFRNGRYQLAFATPNELHVIDRDGNPVKPFPLKFRDAISQPLSIFDYDNNRDYRFVVTQGRELLMYDRQGKRVRGFSFSKAGSEILQSPKHLRLGRKDYIIVAEKSGKLNILSRTGKIRVPVKENIEFSENEWYEYNGNFLSSNTAGEIIKVSEKGSVKRENLNLTENTRLTATPSTLVTLSENELSIKGKSVTLDFGLYGAPQIFYINNKIYISVPDLQAHKVYLFDSNARLLPGFPVYGNSLIDISNADGDNALELVVQGEEDQVLVYEVNQ